MNVLISFCVMMIINFSAGTRSAGSFIDSRDGKEYKWVKIGSQTWMAQNLAYKPVSGLAHSYENNEANLIKYAYLYD